MHRFFVSPDNIEGPQVRFSPAQSHQLAHVLRLKPGASVMVLDNDGGAYEVQLTAVSARQVVGDIIEKQPAAGEPQVQITLYMALLKRDKFEWVLQKCTEVGVWRFVPVVTARSLLQSLDIKKSKLNRWHTILTEAAEQAGRGRIPELCQPMKVMTAFTELDAERAFIPWEGEGERRIRTGLAGQRPSSLALFIGPEGGFDPLEIEAARQAGVQPVTLGERILRAETAAVVAAATFLYELEGR